jgi:shikimate dehydrogenase
LEDLEPRVTARTKVYCLIGRPVEHSLSPAIHNASFRAMGLDCIYVAFDVEPPSLDVALKSLKALGIRGANVTHPYKEEALRFLDEVDREALVTRSVNTIKNEGGALKGYNTDGYGALRALVDALGDLSGLKVAVVGAGGAGRSLVYRLSTLDCEVYLLNRTPERARELVERLKGSSRARLHYAGLDDASIVSRADVLVNATPVGMTLPGTPVDPRYLRDQLLVFDMVYSPPRTPLLVEAERRGIKTLNGIPMLVHQAAEAERLWLGLEPPLSVMLEVARRACREGAAQ